MTSAAGHERRTDRILAGMSAAFGAAYSRLSVAREQLLKALL